MLYFIKNNQIYVIFNQSYKLLFENFILDIKTGKKMKKNTLSLSICTIFISSIAIADQVTIYDGSGQELMSTNQPATVNIGGDRVEVQDGYVVDIYQGKDQKGQSARVRSGEDTPFSFQSVEIKEDKEKPDESKLPPGLLIQVKKGASCVHLATELDTNQGLVNLYPEGTKTYTLPQYNQPNFRQFIEYCPTNPIMNVNEMAIEKVGAQTAKGGVVLFTVISTDSQLHSYRGYNFYLRGHLPNKEGAFGNFTPDLNFDYMGNYGNWRQVLQVKNTAGNTTGYAIFGRTR